MDCNGNAYVFDGLGYLNGGTFNPSPQRAIGFGYDPTAYIATAKLVSIPYTSQDLIEAKLGGQIKLIEACDDNVPPVGTLSPTIDPGNTPNPVYITLQSIIQNVTTEINGYLSSIYPVPLAQTGTVAILMVTSVSSDGQGIIQPNGIQVIWAGNYQTAPDSTNNPAYLNYLDSECNEQWFGCNWQFIQRGTGAQLTVTYDEVDYSDESGQTLQASKVASVVVANGGTGYCVNQLLVLTGGSSFVPAKVREAALSLICHDLYQRRITPEEKNIFAMQNRLWRVGDKDEDGLLLKIGHGDQELDGTYKRNFSPGWSWNQQSVLFNANSL